MLSCFQRSSLRAPSHGRATDRARAGSRARAGGAGRALQILATFVPAIGAVHADPRGLLLWRPLARAARQLYPEEFSALDRAAGATFPFSDEIVQEAHARWTTEWLTWEGAHDAEFKLKAATLEHELAASGGSPIVRARLDAVEREKLDRYQRRYECIRISKALRRDE